MRIGFLQFAPVLGDTAASIKRIIAALEHRPRVDLLVWPELCNSGYNFVSDSQARESSEDCSNGPFSTFVRQSCRALNCHIVAGINERRGDRLYNSAILVNPDGTVGTYRKMHLYLNEPDFFERGDTLPTAYDIDGVKVAMLLCFDWAFPEVWRMAAIAGAQVICHPSNIVKPQRAMRGLAGHALCNRTFIVTANRTGTEGNLTFGGQSTVLSPSGDVILQASPNENGVKIVEIDPNDALDKQMTPRNHVMDDRRPEMYGPITDTGEGD